MFIAKYSVQLEEWEVSVQCNSKERYSECVQCSEASLKEGKQCFEQTLCLQNTCPHSPTPPRREGKSLRKNFQGKMGNGHKSGFPTDMFLSILKSLSKDYFMHT